MTLGLAERQGGLFNVAVARCEAELPERSISHRGHLGRAGAQRCRFIPPASVGSEHWPLPSGRSTVR